jgi:hypothetical protein
VLVMPEARAKTEALLEAKTRHFFLRRMYMPARSSTTSTTSTREYVVFPLSGKKSGVELPKSYYSRIINHHYHHHHEAQC